MLNYCLFELLRSPIPFGFSKIYLCVHFFLSHNNNYDLIIIVNFLKFYIECFVRSMFYIFVLHFPVVLLNLKNIRNTYASIIKKKCSLTFVFPLLLFFLYKILIVHLDLLERLPIIITFLTFSMSISFSPDFW